MTSTQYSALYADLRACIGLINDFSGLKGVEDRSLGPIGEVQYSLAAPVGGSRDGVHGIDYRPLNLTNHERRARDRHETALVAALEACAAAFGKIFQYSLIEFEFDITNAKVALSIDGREAIRAAMSSFEREFPQIARIYGTTARLEEYALFLEGQTFEVLPGRSPANALARASYAESTLKDRAAKTIPFTPPKGFGRVTQIGWMGFNSPSADKKIEKIRSHLEAFLDVLKEFPEESSVFNSVSLSFSASGGYALQVSEFIEPLTHPSDIDAQRKQVAPLVSRLEAIGRDLSCEIAGVEMTLTGQPSGQQPAMGAEMNLSNIPKLPSCYGWVSIRRQLFGLLRLEEIFRKDGLLAQAGGQKDRLLLVNDFPELARFIECTDSTVPKKRLFAISPLTSDELASVCDEVTRELAGAPDHAGDRKVA